MFVKEMQHVLVTWSAGLTKLTTFFRVLEAWCHCDFRKMEALKVNKFGRTYRTGTQAAQAIVVRSYYFLNCYVNVQLAKHDIVTTVIYYYITTKFHYAKRDSCFLACGGVRLLWFEFPKVCIGKNVNRRFSHNFGIFVIKTTDLIALLSFLLYSCFSAQCKAF